jgi:hypothetical protein
LRKSFVYLRFWSNYLNTSGFNILKIRWNVFIYELIQFYKDMNTKLNFENLLTFNSKIWKYFLKIYYIINNDSYDSYYCWHKIKNFIILTINRTEKKKLFKGYLEFWMKWKDEQCDKV